MVSERPRTYPWVRTNRSRTDRFIAWLKSICRRSALLYAGVFLLYAGMYLFYLGLYLVLVAVTERA